MVKAGLFQLHRICRVKWQDDCEFEEMNKQSWTILGFLGFCLERLRKKILPG